jgi:hypothetical protein
MHSFLQKCIGGYILGDFFTNSSCHPADAVFCEPSLIEQKKVLIKKLASKYFVPLCTSYNTLSLHTYVGQTTEASFLKVGLAET